MWNELPWLSAELTDDRPPTTPVHSRIWMQQNYAEVGRHHKQATLTVERSRKMTDSSVSTTNGKIEWTWNWSASTSPGHRIEGRNNADFKHFWYIKIEATIKVRPQIVYEIILEQHPISRQTLVVPNLYWYHRLKIYKETQSSNFPIHLPTQSRKHPRPAQWQSSSSGFLSTPSSQTRNIERCDKYLRQRPHK